MLGRSSRSATWVAVASAALMTWSCSTKSPMSHEKFDNFAYPYPGQTGAIGEDMEKQIIPPGSEPSGASGGALLKAGEPIWIPSGKSRVLHLDQAVRRVSIGNPDLAGIVVLGPKTIMINAKEAPKPESGGGGGGDNIGTVTGKTLTPEPRFAETTLAIWHAGSEVPDIHTLSVADFLDRQVMLEVTVAQLSRTAMEEIGIDFQNVANAFASTFFMGGGVMVPAQQIGNPITNFIPALATNDLQPVYSINLPNRNITALIQYLQNEGLATILAQPKLLAMSGQNAVFQVGGEIPIRIATGFTTAVVFKGFGTIVTFVPRVSEEGDILLTVTPEVSAPDFTSPIEGLPTFRTRRASTASRLKNGETLMIGGLLQSERTETTRGVPYLQDIPAVGLLFRSTAYTDTLTELVIVVTPRLVHPIAPGVPVSLPTDRGPLTNDEIRTKPNPFEATRPRIPGIP